MSEADTVLPAHESLVADWKENAERNGDANFRFLRSLKMVRAERVDAVAHELHRQVFGIIDCTRCAHCCKTMPPQLNDEDIERIAAALHMARAEFITAYLVPDEVEGGLKMKATPCAFLGRDDRCTIYDIRPENCRSFPNTDKEGQIWRTYQLSDNTQNCPAVYHIVEGMRHGRGFKRSHPMFDTPLQVDAIVGELDAPARVLPREAIAAARRHRQHIVPLLIDLIEQATRTAAQGHDVDYNGHFFALYLLTEFRATEALPAIVAAVSLPGEAPFTLFSDAITETLPRVFAVLAHERVADVLLPLIRNRQLNEYVRRAAADSLACMVSAGLRQRDDMMNILKELLRKAVEHTDSELVTGLIGTLCDLYPEEAIEEIRTAYARGLVEEFMITLDDVERALGRGREEALKRLFQRRVFIDDTVKELEGWAAFRPDEDDEEIAFPVKSRPKPLPTVLPASRPAPARHPEGRIGRNDPCPCGSGKKFKKCCALKS